MADGVAPVCDGHLSSSSSKPNKHDLENLRDAARTIPPQALKDLLSNGVCARCIFRLFILHDQICTRPSLETKVLSPILHELTGREGDGFICLVEEAEDFVICRVCLGISQLVYKDDNGILVRKNHATDFSAAIGDDVKKEGYQLESFYLEVSLPQAIVENDQAVRSYMKIKYGSQPWFREKYTSKSIYVKDFLKLSVENALEILIDVKSKESSLRIRLTYTLSLASTKEQPFHESNECYKRRKIDDIDSIKNCADLHKAETPEGPELTRKFSIESEDDGNGFLTFPLEKFSRNVSQSRWIIDDERMGEASVEEILGGQILPICRGDSYKFHAAGREDIDVRMLGTWRPFLVEIQNARQFPSDVLIKDIERKINSLKSKLVSVKYLKFLGSQGWELMREGEAENQKQYAALVWIARPFNEDDAHTLSMLKDTQIMQKTPVRVLHRRSPLERERTIHGMRVERVAGSSHYFLLHLCTQAGTYIKEFVHGDLGRTHPSVGSILDAD